jgi:hypothetical protein
MPTPTENADLPLWKLMRGSFKEDVAKPVRRITADAKKGLMSLYTKAYQRSDKVLTPYELWDIQRVLTPAQQAAKKFAKLTAVKE